MSDGRLTDELEVCIRRGWLGRSGQGIETQLVIQAEPPDVDAAAEEAVASSSRWTYLLVKPALDCLVDSFVYVVVVCVFM